MMVLFLDFDGVLHPDPCRDPQRLFEHAPALSAVLDDYPEAQVVLSTSWRTKLSFEQLCANLPPALRARACDVTPVYGSFSAPPALVPYRRQAECLAWLEQHAAPDTPWLALDDRAGWFEPYCETLILCHSDTGLDAPTLTRLASMLQRARSRSLRARGVDLLF